MKLRSRRLPDALAADLQFATEPFGLSGARSPASGPRRPPLRRQAPSAAFKSPTVPAAAKAGTASQTSFRWRLRIPGTRR